MHIEDIKEGDTILLKDKGSTGGRRILIVERIRETLNNEFIFTCNISGYNRSREIGGDKFLEILETGKLH